MSVILRHKKFPFIMVYSDPKDSWDKASKEMLLEEIRHDGFDNFVEGSSAPLLYRKLFNPLPEEVGGNKAESNRLKKDE